MTINKSIDDNKTYKDISEILIEYSGKFKQEYIDNYMDIIENTISNLGLMSDISIAFAEQYQNILNYGKSEDQDIDYIVSLGYITLQKDFDDIYIIKSKNIISKEDKEKIEQKLIKILSLEKIEIRQKYRELRRSGINTHDKGGGIGFYEVAKRAKKIEYEFNKINSNRYEFVFISYIGSD